MSLPPSTDYGFWLFFFFFSEIVWILEAGIDLHIWGQICTDDRFSQFLIHFLIRMQYGQDRRPDMTDIMEASSASIFKFFQIFWAWMSEFLGDGIMHCLDVPFFYGMANGHQAVTNKSMPVGAIPLAQDCSRPHLRMGLTHIALFVTCQRCNGFCRKSWSCLPTTRFLETCMA